MVVGDFTAEQQGLPIPEKKGWLQRLLHPSSPRHKRSVSDLAHMLHSRHEPPKMVDIQDMVRLSGKSMLYLPPEYTPCSLVLPTCRRATAQHLSQNITARGLFRIPGSVRVVTALFDHYCRAERSDGNISSAVHGTSLPLHIAHSVHDVASTFKRLLSVLPGGILGSIALLDALVAIYSQLLGEPEFPRTKQTKVRARLIALAIGTVKSQFRRELICAVFGLLSLIGRAAEVTPREDDEGRPLPTSDLMGYGALGIVFGPLLVGNMLEQYTMKLASPTSGMLLFPLSHPRLRRDRVKTKISDGGQTGAPFVDKIMIANGIAEMLISNWRDIVRQMRSLGMHYRKDASSINLRKSSRPSGEQYRIPSDSNTGRKGMKDVGTEPDTSTRLSRRRSKPLRSSVSQRLLPKMSMMTLSPTREECSADSDLDHPRSGREDGQACNKSQSPIVRIVTPHDQTPVLKPEVHPENIPPRISSRPREDQDSFDAIVPGTRPAEFIEPCTRSAEKRLEMPSVNISRHASSFDGSDDSPSRTASQPASRGGQECMGKQYPFEKRATHPSTTVASLAATSLDLERMKLDDSHEQPIAASRSYLERVSARDSEGSTNIGDQFAHTLTYVNDTTSLLDLEDLVSINKAPNLVHSKSNTGDSGRMIDRPAHDDESANGEQRAQRCGELSRYTVFERMTQAEAILKNESGNRHGTCDDRNEVSSKRYEENETRGVKQQACVDSCQKHKKILVLTPSRSSSSETRSKRGSVRNIAAALENHESIGEGTGRATNNDVEIFYQASTSHDSSSEKRTMSFLENELIDSQDARKGIDAASQTDESLQVDVAPLTISRSMPTLKLNMAGKSPLVPSLGTMIPHRELPPVAHHIHRPRPCSALQNAKSDVPIAPVSRASSGTTLLYGQIQQLQRQLGLKTEEASQLQRQLDAHGGAEAGTLSEQLRQAMRDASMWRHRAVTAERRVKVFERFTARLRGIRDAIFQQPETARPRDCHKCQAVNVDEMVQRQRSSGEVDETYPRDMTADDSGDSHDGVIVAARIRKCLHGRSPAVAGGGLDSVNSSHSFTGGDGTSSPLAHVYSNTELMWQVAQELLQIEEEGIL